MDRFGDKNRLEKPATILLYRASQSREVPDPGSALVQR
jgi:hypothetical protein